MNKKIISLLLCVWMLLGIVLPVSAEETEAETELIQPVTITISNVEDFLAFAENCRLDSYSVNLVVSLKADLDLTNVDSASIPTFSGTFQGNGHSISGLKLDKDGSVVGLFRYLTYTAVVRDLHISGDVAPQGSRGEVGGIAGENAGHIENCTFTGRVSGGDYVGGLVGRNAVTGLVENCSVEGDIHGNHFVGGIAGENSGVIRDCENRATVNTTPQQNTVGLSDITLDTMANAEAVNTVTDIGGIAGISMGVIRNCDNHGDVGYQQMGYNIGGIAGTQSGYIVDCANHGTIHGRKEVGGIVGQMEPVTRIEYAEDTLQILQEQLNAMSGMVGQVSANAQTNAGEITGNIALLQDQTETARDAVLVLIPTVGNLSRPDDEIVAAQNTLASTMNAMPETVNSIAAAAENTVSGISRDLQAVSGQISAMSRTINEASENLGGSIMDVSDLDTEELLTGKISGCSNFGDVMADLNVGGIAGAMSMETDLDILEDWEQSGEDSMNFQSEIRAVLINSRNHGTVTATKQNAGGIVGWQHLGLVKNCENDGMIDSANASYVGGIAGMSTGYLRSNYAKCQIRGTTYAGGIAGSAAVVTDSLSQVKLEDVKENVGAILGAQGEASAEEEYPVARNVYLAVEKDVGGIDGISYLGLAEPMDMEAFLAQENLPELFRKVYVRLVYEDGTTMALSVLPGGELDISKIPEVPEKAGATGAWEGLENADLSQIDFDLTFHAVYRSYQSAVESQETRENGRPMLLAEGAFTDEAYITVEKAEGSPALAEGQQLLETWQITMNETASKLRFRLPEDADAENVLLYVRGQNGDWTLAGAALDGSYLVFAVKENALQIALVEEAQNNLLPILAGAAVLVLLVAVFALKKKKAK